jgi:hypothetical protein
MFWVAVACLGWHPPCVEFGARGLRESYTLIGRGIVSYVQQGGGVSLSRVLRAP